MTKFKYILITFIAGISLGAYLAKKFYPKVEIKTEILEKEVVKNNVVTVTKEVIKPDGTKEIRTRTTDKSIKTDESALKTYTNVKNWRVGIMTGIPNTGLNSISLIAERRVLGPFSIIGSLDSNINAKVGITWEF